MLIANPIYDVVFKKLMEDPEIARGVLERILNTQVEQLEFASQEFTTATDDGRLTFFRLDFKARICTTDGWKDVLIELQKARLASDVDRFRSYLASEYRTVSEVPYPDGGIRRFGLPIITVYFFGYTIDPRLPGAFKIDRRYVDIITGEELSARCDVMERLTHDAYAVQIPKLGNQQRNEVEELLSVFRQDRPADEYGHTLVIDEDSPHSLLLKRIIRTLTRLIEKPEVQRAMSLEDEMFETLAREIEEKTREYQQERDEANRERDNAERERDNAKRERDEAQTEIERLKLLLREHGIVGQ